MSRSVRVMSVAAVATAAAVGAVGVVPAQAASRPVAAVVTRADVDGDGRADRTTLTRLDKGRAFLLRTTTARGRTSTVRVATPFLYGATSPFVGAPRLDGARGAEIVVRTGSGAHTQFFAVYSWRHGRLVAQKDPATGSREWITDGALSSSMGYTLRTVKGVRQLTSLAVTRDSWDADATFSGRRVTSVWRHGRWVPVTDRAVVIEEGPAVWSGGGWNVPGLPRW